jgi:S1-C subfamily serine protease
MRPWGAAFSGPIIQSRSIARVVGLLFHSCLTLVLCGCVIQTTAPAPQSHTQYPVVAASQAETFAGTVDNNLATGTAYVDLLASGSQTRCRGEGHLVKSAAGCTGGQGACSLQCDDGAVIECRYELRSCVSGYGLGLSDDRRWFAFSFGPGMSGLEGQQVTAKLKTYVASLPSTAAARKQRQETGFTIGTGFFVAPGGYLVSAFHVVEGARKVSVVLRSGEVARAEVKGVDSANDIALLKVKRGINPLPIVSSQELTVGEQVFTVGYPLVDIEGQEQKATFGRVNALSGIQDDVRFVQIDVPIQPGNSGGPLIDSRGRVVGVVDRTLDPAALLKETGTVPQNTNYAVKSDYVLPLMIRYEVKPAAARAGRSEREPEMIRRVRDSIVMVVAR